MIPPNVESVQICCDEEETDPFGVPERTVDMAVSCLSMHWVNDLETAMVNIRRVLRKDGFMLHSMFGGNTLYELREFFSMAQTEVLGRVLPHISPMIDGAGLSTLVLQTGFNLPSIDVDRHLLLYQTPFHLMEYLSAMGESACHYKRHPLNRDVLLAVCATYDAMYGKNELIPATFEMFHTIAWSPSPTQAKPLERGSGMVPLSSWNSHSRKRLQELLDEFAQNLDDEALQSRAEDLFQQLHEESVALLEQKGLDVRRLDKRPRRGGTRDRKTQA
ncbi:S-adenosyl-L-methionine-dependent methyltransferase [Trypanosoma rangeli]|uniref:S-adenosyl-L-methionine-dependent methyltransferase n=1 Tax=Trypanosoma rangeli TaxID=5698 RepID=A0A422NMU6_TRYRA|nr:S-adenosyl-L-methionine-dependent methyltransferase [Trypanosoma rangeli]RNF06817.1 S-adenosyl-L-methionine-dependent methyltransferase [Trypanosoma rangeli]|eukprot:RNF06817.1 S-adenosyl-L-methionine-dependent methyltransferase [Trypanosoma rangeli]